MTWFKVDDQLPDHRKVRKLGADRLAAMGLWTLCGAWASGNSDGFVPLEVVTRYDPKLRYTERLCAVGLWETATDDGEQGYVFHDWSEYRQPRGREEKKRSDTRRRVQEFRGRKRAEQAQRANDGTFVPPAAEDLETETDPGNALPGALPGNAGNATCNPAPDPTRPVRNKGSRSVGGYVPSEIADAITDETESEPTPDVVVEPREDVEALCRHLADRIEGNGSKRPRITKAWREQARLLVDRDGRDVDKAHRLIDWCQDHHHWRSRVQALPKFRSEYDAMRLQANAEHERGHGDAATKPARVSSAANTIAALQARKSTNGATPPLAAPSLRALPEGPS